MALDNEFLQFVAWGIALAELILGLYVLAFNVWESVNRWIGGVLLLFALNAFAVGFMARARGVAQALWPSRLLAAAAPAVQPAILTMVLALLYPGRPDSRWRYVRWAIYVLAVLPAVATVVDAYSGSRLWYTGLDAAGYSGGYVPMSTFTAGVLSWPFRVVNFFVLAILGIAVSLVALFRAKGDTRRLAGWVLGAYVIALVFEMGFKATLSGGLGAVLSGAVFVACYAYIALHRAFSSRRKVRGKLGLRITAMVLAVTIPPFVIAPGLLIPSLLEAHMREDADERLLGLNQALEGSISLWLQSDIATLRQVVTLPDIVSMEPERQKPVLEAVVRANPHIYLACTIDLEGMNVARSDAAAPFDYSDREWFRAARDGSPVTLETLLSRSRGTPALIVAMPIRDSSGQIVGVGMMANELKGVARDLFKEWTTATGTVYVVDQEGLVVVHQNPLFAVELRDYSDYPPVSHFLKGGEGWMSFTDEDGHRWRAYVGVLDYGWGVVAQQREDEILSPLQAVRRWVWMALIVGTILVGGLISLGVHRVLRPVSEIGEAVGGVIAGDLSRTVAVVGSDELGTLATALNKMIGQLRELSQRLEAHVTERTAALERRATYLEAAAQVARDVTLEIDSQQLFERVVTLIGERFGFYHVGLFLVDETGEWAVLQAAYGERGQAMLEQGHRLRVGEEGIVGYVTGYGEPRVAGEVGEDVVYYDNPNLPGTRSEVALPLKLGDRVLGALDVQSLDANAFGEDVVSVLQLLADQVAAAISRAGGSRWTFGMDTSGRADYGVAGWQVRGALLADRSIVGYVCGERGVEALRKEAGSPVEAKDEVELRLPIVVRGQVVGTLVAQKPDGDKGWSGEEERVLRILVERLGVALESARLYQDVQRRAVREQLTREITDRLRGALNMDALLQTVIREAASAVGASRAFVQWVGDVEVEGNGDE